MNLNHHEQVHGGPGLLLRLFSQIIQSRYKVPHKGHEKEGKLEDIFADEIKSVNKRVVPGYLVHGVNQCHEPEQHPDTPDLRFAWPWISLARSPGVRVVFRGDLQEWPRRA